MLLHRCLEIIGDSVFKAIGPSGLQEGPWPIVVTRSGFIGEEIHAGQWYHDVGACYIGERSLITPEKNAAACHLSMQCAHAYYPRGRVWSGVAAGNAWANLGNSIIDMG